MSNPTQRPEPTRRKERVATATFGDLVVCGMTLSERLGVTDVAAIDGESAADRSRRVGKLFTSRLLAATVRDLDGAEVYDAEGWDLFLGSHAAELDPLVDKALRINNFNLPDPKTGDVLEEPAKNA